MQIGEVPGDRFRLTLAAFAEFDVGFGPVEDPGIGGLGK